MVRKNDRILVLSKIDPKNKDTGMFDPKVFSGENNLHVVMDLITGLWTFRYERGIIPGAMKGRFSSFKEAYNFAEAHLKTKNIKIIEVLD